VSRGGIEFIDTYHTQNKILKRERYNILYRCIIYIQYISSQNTHTKYIYRERERRTRLPLACDMLTGKGGVGCDMLHACNTD
jgi:hypothetical protein